MLRSHPRSSDVHGAYRARSRRQAVRGGLLLAVVVLVVSGYAYKTVGDLNQIGDGVPIAGNSSVGQMNILVMGLESRTTFLGQELDHHLQFVMHVGSNGSQDTDTLILVHIFPAAAGSWLLDPRDDLVTHPEPYDGFTRRKIDGAYYFAYVQSLNSTSGSSMSQNDRYKAANRAGQAAEIATVEAVTGETVDNYVTMNLIGFYELANDFGGVEVCVTPTTVNGVRNANLADAASGWDAVADGSPEEERLAVSETDGRPVACVRPGPGQPAQRGP